MMTVYILSDIARAHLLSRPRTGWYKVAPGKRGTMPAELLMVYEAVEAADAAVAALLRKRTHTRVAVGTLDEAGRSIKYNLRLPKGATSLVAGRSA